MLLLNSMLLHFVEPHYIPSYEQTIRKNSIALPHNFSGNLNEKLRNGLFPLAISCCTLTFELAVEDTLGDLLIKYLPLPSPSELEPPPPSKSILLLLISLCF